MLKITKVSEMPADVQSRAALIGYVARVDWDGGGCWLREGENAVEKARDFQESARVFRETKLRK